MAVLRPLMVIFSASTWIFFTKLKFRRSGRVYILIGSKVMTQNTNISLSIFFQFCKKSSYLCNIFLFFTFLRFFFCICAITFEPIKIWTCSTSQNDRLNFSFVKDIKKKWLEIVVKWHVTILWKKKWKEKYLCFVS